MNLSREFSQKELRKLLKDYETKNNKLALFLFFCDYGLFLFGGYVVFAVPIYLKPFGSIIIFVAMFSVHDKS
jgi:hypothetical protein